MAQERKPRDVGILTFHHVNNFGAVLQTAGTVAALRELGMAPRVIDYRPRAAREYYAKKEAEGGKFLRVLMKRWRFYRFRRKALPLTKKLLTAEAIAPVAARFDTLVCGSDQVWYQEGFRGFDPPFFLDVGEAFRGRRASYAASFGATTKVGPLAKRIGALLDRFDDLSVRDERSRKIVRDLCGREAEVVLDPCFLHDYEPLAVDPKFAGDYLAVYYFGLTKRLRQTVEAIAAKRNLPIVSLGNRFPGAAVQAEDIGPAEWLGWMQNAKFICTNSFHGVVFALKWNKNFAALPRENHQNKVDDLLLRAGLAGRLVPAAASPDDLPESAYGDIDYDEPNRRIDEFIARSRQFLQHVAKEVVGRFHLP